MFQLTSREGNELVTNWHRFVSLKHSTVLPYAFTEHGVAMLSSVLHGKRAIHINILIIKVFVKLREILTTHKKLAQRLQELEALVNTFPAVEKSYALQAGREIRIFVTPEKISDAEAKIMARDIAIKIEQELKYPGEIKVTMIRETRIVEYAR